MFRLPEAGVFFYKGVLKICSKPTGEHPCQSAISIKLLTFFIEIAIQHGCSSVNLLHGFRIPFPKNTSGRLLLNSFKGVLGIWTKSWKKICGKIYILVKLQAPCLWLDNTLRESIKIRIFFWSVFSCIRTRKNSLFGYFPRSDN